MTITLLTYVTLDAIQFHVWFTTEDAVIVPWAQTVITIAGVSFLAFIQQKQKRLQPQSTTAERKPEAKPTRAWYFVAFFLGIIGGHNRICRCQRRGHVDGKPTFDSRISNDIISGILRSLS